MRIQNGVPAASIHPIVLFPFDDQSIPFQHEDEHSSIQDEIQDRAFRAGTRLRT